MCQLISTKKLFENLNDSNLVIFDCSWFLPSENRKPEAEYRKKHIKGSHFFNIEKISDLKNKLPHMVPDIKYFKSKTKYFNIHINILVYTDVIDQKILKSILTNYNLESLGFSLCLYPITEPASTLIRFHFKKFIAISNFENKEDIYSILGSEITEVL